MKRIKLLQPLFFIALFLSPLGTAQASIQGVPSPRSPQPSLTIHQRVLDRSCFSLPAPRFGLNCNPAFQADRNERFFRLNLMADDNLHEFETYSQRLERDDVLVAADDFLNNREAVQAHGSAAFWYQHDWWSLGYVIGRGEISYLQRNPAFPEVSAHAFAENEVFAQFGLISTESEHIKVGLQARYTSREFIYQQFYALDAVMDPALIEVKNQKVLYLEPGFAFSWDSEWEPVISWTLTQFPVLNQGAKAERRPISDIGFSSNLKSILPGLRTATHYHKREGTDFSRHLTWSALYDFTPQISGSLHTGRDVFAIGIEARLLVVNLGLSYQNESRPLDSWSSSRIRSTTAQVGLSF